MARRLSRPSSGSSCRCRSRPLGAFAIFQFLWVWNDLLVALVFLGPGADVRVLPTALYNLIGSRGGAWHLLTAGAFVTMLVPLPCSWCSSGHSCEGSWPAPSSHDPGAAHDRLRRRRAAADAARRINEQASPG